MTRTELAAYAFAGAMAALFVAWAVLGDVRLYVAANTCAAAALVLLGRFGRGRP